MFSNQLMKCQVCGFKQESDSQIESGWYYLSMGAYLSPHKPEYEVNSSVFQYSLFDAGKNPHLKRLLDKYSSPENKKNLIEE